MVKVNAYSNNFADNVAVFRIEDGDSVIKILPSLVTVSNVDNVKSLKNKVLTEKEKENLKNQIVLKNSKFAELQWDLGSK